MERPEIAVGVAALIVGSLVGAGAVTMGLGPQAPGTDGPTAERLQSNVTTGLTAAEQGVAQFENDSSFAEYVEQGQLLAANGDATTGLTTLRGEPATVDVVTAETGGDAGADSPTSGGSGGSGDSGPSRVGTSNVQVAGLDEPDIVKTDGQNFYYAPRTSSYGYWTGTEGKTHVVDASTPSSPEVIGDVNTSGKLLQTGDRLIVIRHDRIVGYDVSDPSSPSQAWEQSLNASVVTARERNGTIYLVTSNPVGVGSACPVEPLGADHAIPCDEIYRPGTQIPVDSTYSAFTIDAGSGDVADSVSFVGTNDNTVVYVSHDALYVTYTERANRAQLRGQFIREEYDRTPDHLAERIAEIQSYDISSASKIREMRMALDRWASTLPAEERENVRQSFSSEYANFTAAHQRNLTQTGIVRVDVSGSSLTVDATGVVPGRPLDQFSMDQHNGTLRITTTIPQTGSASSENDLYVLDATSLDQRGSVTGMGETERVYSVRYVDDTAYVVTFRRIDPFHVIDLSDPANPVEKGELELPGFSSYLHPIDEDHVLGIGEEDGTVKTVLFDVSNESNPTIADDHHLDSYWSAIQGSHHAFTIDRRHGVFFLPANNEGIVVDYTNGTLSEVTRITTAESVRRARYVDDSLYVFAGSQVVVLDEQSWERTETLSLAD